MSSIKISFIHHSCHLNVAGLSVFVLLDMAASAVSKTLMSACQTHVNTALLVTIVLMLLCASVPWVIQVSTLSYN